MQKGCAVSTRTSGKTAALLVSVVVGVASVFGGTIGAVLLWASGTGTSTAGTRSGGSQGQGIPSDGTLSDGTQSDGTQPGGSQSQGSQHSAPVQPSQGHAPQARSSGS